jgi:hypothetical protein
MHVGNSQKVQSCLDIIHLTNESLRGYTFSHPALCARCVLVRLVVTVIVLASLKSIGKIDASLGQWYRNTGGRIVIVLGVDVWHVIFLRQNSWEFCHHSLGEGRRHRQW